MIITDDISDTAYYENKEILLIFSPRALKEKVIEKQFENPDYSNT